MKGIASKQVVLLVSQALHFRGKFTVELPEPL
jgi:hypothetical protein